MSPPLVGVDSVSTREIAVKKYVVKLSAEERERLQALIRSGKHSARKLIRARILLKADAPEAGEAWSDSQIADALDTGLATVARIRQQLVEEGVEGVLTPKRSPNSARKRIFDGASEAKLIALAGARLPSGVEDAFAQGFHELLRAADCQRCVLHDVCPHARDLGCHMAGRERDCYPPRVIQRSVGAGQRQLGPKDATVRHGVHDDQSVAVRRKVAVQRPDEIVDLGLVPNDRMNHLAKELEKHLVRGMQQVKAAV